MLNYMVHDATRELTIARSLDRYEPPFKVVGGYKLIDNGIVEYVRGTLGRRPPRN